MRSMVRRWGNGASVCIPTAVLEAAKLGLNQPVDVREEAGRIIIESIRPVYDVTALVAGITEADRHEPIAMGKAVGRETW